MRSRIAAGLAGVVCVVLAAVTPVPQSQATEVTAPAPVVQQMVTDAVAPLHLTLPSMLPATDDRPKVIDPKTYNVDRGPNLSQRVVLTYDDCPKNLASLTAVLRFVRGNNIGLVLAPTGACYDRFKKKYKVDIAQLIRSYGQYAINHSRTHPNLTTLGPVGIKWQLGGEVKADYGRPPYGKTNKKVAAGYKAAGMRQWLWNKDIRDWEKGGKTEDQIVNDVVRQACAGCTLLMHMQHRGFTPHAIGTIQARLRADTKKLELCRPFRGWANPAGGPVRVAPAMFGNNSLPC